MGVFRSLKLKCQIAEARRAGASVRAFLVEAGCDEREILDCELAVVEACNNAIQYASPAGRRHPIVLDMTCDLDTIEFYIRDHTPGFNWPGKAELPPGGSESGRGIYLIQTVMDSTDYIRGTGGNLLILRRLRSRRGTVAASLK